MQFRKEHCIFILLIYSDYFGSTGIFRQEVSENTSMNIIMIENKIFEI